MKSSAILREAARMIESGKATNGLCDAIGCCTSNNPDLFQKAIDWLRLVGPPFAHNGEYWFGPPARTGANQSRRIIAARQAAAIAESEGD